MVNKIIRDALSSGKKIFLWGASSSGHRAYYRLLNLGAKSSNISFIDTNYKNIQSSTGLEIQSPDVLKSLNLDSSIILISSTISKEIIESLDLQLNPITYYIHELIFERNQSYKYPKEFADLISKINLELNLDQEEAYNIWNIIINLNKTPGDLIEIGVYKGASIKVIHSAAELSDFGMRSIHGFDTFEGIPVNIGHGDEKFNGYLSDNSFKEVRKSLPLEINLHPGIFPQSAINVAIEKIAFMHLDVDTYATTLDSLTFFWNKIVASGVILIHDYNSQGCPGVKKAVDEFMSTKNSFFMEISECQAIIVKI
jgi:O-methyltransferase